MTVTITQIYRYPVKGLSPEALETVDLAPGRGLPDDRRFALTLGTTRVDGPTIAWMDKTNFLSLLRHEKLAKLKTKFDGDTGVLEILRGGKAIAKGNITTPVGRAMVEEFFAAFMGEAALGRPKLVEAENSGTLSDHSNPVVSLINLASVKDLERVTGATVNPLRFRGNVYLEGLEPWAEFGWVDKEITLGGATLKITKRIDRCTATNVDPQTAVRDLSIPKDLYRGFGHIDMGVYASTTTAGTIKSGDICTPSE
ncbi:MAG: MOSC domain-containing protein [Rhodospirillales bacterium]|nr:MOSC domain-containing protein [Rhodospirillales bacterium]